MSSRGTSVSAGVPVGGLAPGSYEAKTAIDRVRLAMHPDLGKRNDPAWSKPRKAEPKPKAPKVERERIPRFCIDCNAEITGPGNAALRCGECRKIAAKAKSLAYYHRNKAAPKGLKTDLRCMFCGAEIPPTIQRKLYCSQTCSDKQSALNKRNKRLPPRG